MTTRQIENRVKKLRELEAKQKEIEKQINALKDEIKSEMQEQGTDELITDECIIRWTEVTSNRFDTSNFKKNFADLYSQFTRQVTSRRFSIS